jgi:hypothetical protein
VGVQDVIDIELEKDAVAPAIIVALTGTLEAAGIDWTAIDSFQRLQSRL